jgi:hypothetical protein
MARGPHWFAITPDGTRGYATNKEAPDVSVVDLETGTLVDRIAVPGSEGIAASPDGRTVALAAPYGDLSRPASDPTGVRLVDVTAGKVTGLLPTEHLVYPVHITATGLLLAGEVVVECSGSSSALGVQRPGQVSVFALDRGGAARGVAGRPVPADHHLEPGWHAGLRRRGCGLHGERAGPAHPRRARHAASGPAGGSRRARPRLHPGTVSARARSVYEPACLARA